MQKCRLMQRNANYVHEYDDINPITRTPSVKMLLHYSIMYKIIENLFFISSTFIALYFISTQCINYSIVYFPEANAVL